jgi:hypothetical protein
MSDMYGSWQNKSGIYGFVFWHNGGMRHKIKIEKASLAGGLGACYAPGGEREGRSRLAWMEQQ